MTKFSYLSQRTLVTGASSGIGAELARQLAAKGSHLVLVARRADRLETLAEELRTAHGVEVAVIATDLREPAPGRRLLKEVQRRGLTITGVVNNAGFGQWELFQDADPTRLQQLIAVNVAAVVDISRAFLPSLQRTPGAFLVNLTSVAAYASIPMQGTYSATKAFVLSFTESLWAETRGSHVRVLAFAPGVTCTEFFDVVGTTDADGGSRYQTPAQVAAEALRVLAGKNPPPSAVSGHLNHWLSVVPRYLTRRRAVLLFAANTMAHK